MQSQSQKEGQRAQEHSKASATINMNPSMLYAYQCQPVQNYYYPGNHTSYPASNMAYMHYNYPPLPVDPRPPDPRIQNDPRPDPRIQNDPRPDPRKQNDPRTADPLKQNDPRKANAVNSQYAHMNRHYEKASTSSTPSSVNEQALHNSVREKRRGPSGVSRTLSNSDVRKSRKTDKSVKISTLYGDSNIANRALRHWPNSRYAKMKLNKTCLKMVTQGFIPFLSSNDSLILKGCWQKEILARSGSTKLDAVEEGKPKEPRKVDETKEHGDAGGKKGQQAPTLNFVDQAVSAFLLEQRQSEEVEEVIENLCRVMDDETSTVPSPYRAAAHEGSVSSPRRSSNHEKEVTSPSNHEREVPSPSNHEREVPSPPPSVDEDPRANIVQYRHSPERRIEDGDSATIRSDDTAIEQQQEERSTPCRYFLKGHCRHGDNCAYKHTVEDQSETSSTDEEDSKDTVCRFYIRGYCKFGDACCFKHCDEDTDAIHTSVGAILQALQKSSSNAKEKTKDSPKSNVHAKPRSETLQTRSSPDIRTNTSKTNRINEMAEGVTKTLSMNKEPSEKNRDTTTVIGNEVSTQAKTKNYQLNNTSESRPKEIAKKVSSGKGREGSNERVGAPRSETLQTRSSPDIRTNASKTNRINKMAEGVTKTLSMNKEPSEKNRDTTTVIRNEVPTQAKTKNYQLNNASESRPKENAKKVSSGKGREGSNERVGAPRSETLLTRSSPDIRTNASKTNRINEMAEGVTKTLSMNKQPCEKNRDTKTVIGNEVSTQAKTKNYQLNNTSESRPKEIAKKVSSGKGREGSNERVGAPVQENTAVKETNKDNDGSKKGESTVKPITKNGEKVQSSESRKVDKEITVKKTNLNNKDNSESRKGVSTVKPITKDGKLQSGSESRKVDKESKVKQSGVLLRIESNEKEQRRNKPGNDSVNTEKHQKKSMDKEQGKNGENLVKENRVSERKIIEKERVEKQAEKVRVEKQPEKSSKSDSVNRIRAESKSDRHKNKANEQHQVGENVKENKANENKNRKQAEEKRESIAKPHGIIRESSKKDQQKSVSKEQRNTLDGEVKDRDHSKAAGKNSSTRKVDREDKRIGKNEEKRSSERGKSLELKKASEGSRKEIDERGNDGSRKSSSEKIKNKESTSSKKESDGKKKQELKRRSCDPIDKETESKVAKRVLENGICSGEIGAIKTRKDHESKSSSLPNVCDTKSANKSVKEKKRQTENIQDHETSKKIRTAQEVQERLADETSGPSNQLKSRDENSGTSCSGMELPAQEDPSHIIKEEVEFKEEVYDTYVKSEPIEGFELVSENTSNPETTASISEGMRNAKKIKALEHVLKQWFSFCESDIATSALDYFYNVMKVMDLPIWRDDKYSIFDIHEVNMRFFFLKVYCESSNVSWEYALESMQKYPDIYKFLEIEREVASSSS